MASSHGSVFAAKTTRGTGLYVYYKGYGMSYFKKAFIAWVLFMSMFSTLLQAGILSNVSITLSDSKTDVQSVYTVNFTTQTELVNTNNLLVLQFDINKLMPVLPYKDYSNGAASANCAELTIKLNGIDSNICAGYNSSIWETTISQLFISVNNTIPAGTEVSISIPGFTNPSTEGEITPYLLRTSLSGGALIDTPSSMPTFTIENPKPVVTSTPVTSVDEDSAYSYTLGGSHADGDSLTWSVKSGTSLPSWLELNTTTVPSSITTLIDSGLYSPYGVAVDSSGNIYIADTYNSAIKKRDTAGTVTTLIGSGLNYPVGVAVDTDGNIYIADTENHAIKKRDTAGTVTTLIDSGLHYPYGVAVDSGGNLYIADRDNHAIKKRDTAGVITTLVSSGLSYPSGVAVDSSGNIYIADTNNHAIKKRDTAGNVTTLVSSGLSSPMSVAVDAEGNIYIADTGNSAIKKRDTAGTVTTLVSSGLSYPNGVAVDANGNVYIADSSNDAIKKLSVSTTTTKLTGTPTNADVGDHNISLVLSDGTNEVEHNFTVTVNNVNDAPTDISLSSNSIAESSAIGTKIADLNTTDIDIGDTFTYSLCGGADDANFSISENELQANAVFDYESKNSYEVCVRTTDSGSATFDKNITISITNVNDNIPTVTSTAVTSVDEENLYSYTLTGIDVDGDETTWSVKSGTQLPSWLELNTTTTPSSVTTVVSDLATPSGVAVDAEGNLYFAESNNNTIKKRDTSGNVTTLVSGLNFPYGVAVDADGNLYFADSNNNTIKKRDTNGTVTTLVDSGLLRPYGVAVDSSGNVYIADTFHSAIKKRDTAGTVTTLVSGLNYPIGVAVDADGNIYIADTENHAIKKRDTAGTVTTLIDSGLNNPYGVAVDSSGNIYIADTDNHAIKKRDTDGNITTLVDNNLSAPYGVAVDAEGNIYIADTNNNLIKKLPVRWTPNFGQQYSEIKSNRINHAAFST